MSLQVETLGSTLRIRVLSAMDSETIPALRDQLAAAVAGAVRDIVVDLGAVAYLDGSGVGALAFLHRRAASAGARLRVEAVSGQPLAYLRDLGIARQLGIPEAKPSRRASMLLQARAA